MENYEHDYLSVISAYQALPEDMREEFQKQTGLIPRPVSTKFQRTNITVSCPGQTDYFTQTDIFKMLENSGVIDIIDDEIEGLDFDDNPKKEYKGCKAVFGVVDKLINDIKHKDIIAEGQMLQTHLQVNLLQGALLAIELVKSGAVNEEGKGIIIYLTETINCVSCRLLVWRCDDNFVRVDMSEMCPNDEYGAGDGVLSTE